METYKIFVNKIMATTNKTNGDAIAPFLGTSCFLYTLRNFKILFFRNTLVFLFIRNINIYIMKLVNIHFGIKRLTFRVHVKA